MFGTEASHRLLALVRGEGSGVSMAALYSVFFLVVKMACGHTIWPGQESSRGPDTWRTPFSSAGLGLLPNPGDTLRYQLFFLEPHTSALSFLTSHTVEKERYLSHIFLTVSWSGDQVRPGVVTRCVQR